MANGQPVEAGVGEVVAARLFDAGNVHSEGQGVDHRAGKSIVFAAGGDRADRADRAAVAGRVAPLADVVQQRDAERVEVAARIDVRLHECRVHVVAAEQFGRRWDVADTLPFGERGFGAGNVDRRDGRAGCLVCLGNDGFRHGCCLSRNSGGGLDGGRVVGAQVRNDF